MPKTTPKNITHLRNHGPTPMPQLPNNELSRSDKIRGATLLKLNTTGSGGGDTQGGNSTNVAYLLDEHDPERVVRTYLLANPKLLENLTKQGLVSRFGDVNNAFQDAARRILGETDIKNPHRDSGPPDSENTGGVGRKWTCPLCGVKLKMMRVNSRVDHLSGHD